MPKEKHLINAKELGSSKAVSSLREIVFGMEDGMVSTFGAVTGIAAATQDPYLVLLSGLVVIGVESISMGVGSFIANKSVSDMEKSFIKKEKVSMRRQPEKERAKLEKIYLEDGWPKDLASKMAVKASQNKKLFLKEMTYHGLLIVPERISSPLKNGFFMFFAYIIGGLLPLSPYFSLKVAGSITASVIITLLGLFVLGVATSRFTQRKWWKAGLELLVLAGAAGLVGFLIGQAVKVVWF